MRKRVLHTAVLVLAITSVSHAGVGTWRNFTSLKDVRDVTHFGTTVWAATSGGLFSWVQGTSTQRQFTNADGLQSIDLTAVAADHVGDIWTGTSTGVIHILTPVDGTWRYILDIAKNQNQTNKSINRLAVYGDSVLICTEFGLSVFRRDASAFGDTFTKFGDLPTNVRIRVLDAAVHDGKLWAAISDGQGRDRIAVASLSSRNLLPPESWSLETVGSPPATPQRLQIFNGRLYTGTSRGLFVKEGSAWVAVPTLESSNIVGMAASGSVLAVCTNIRTAFTVSAQGAVTQLGSTLPYSPTSVTIAHPEEVVLGVLNGGVLNYQGTWQSHVPTGPASNQFLSVAVDQAGVLWGASGDANGSGFYRYDGTGWKSFTQDDSPLPTNNYYRISVGCNGSVWASSYGRGIVEIPSASDRVDSQHIFGQNVGMVGVPGDNSFIVTSTVACDGRGNTWMSIVNPSNKNVLAVRRADGTWKLLPLIIGNAKISYLMDRPVDRCLAVDAFDNLWATVREGSYKGVVSLGNRGSIDSTAAFQITSANGLPSDDIKTIVVDNSNEIWIGTDRGIGIILDPSNPLRDGAIAQYRPLTGLVINTIAVDALNQKWVGTTEGAVLLSPDGTQLLAYYTVENTAGKLIDNDIKSIAFDPQSGIVYFGTVSGLAGLTTASPAPKPSFEKLSVSPNPFIVPGIGQLLIDGLVENSTVKILSIDGRLVREVKTPGGRIGFWDGKDLDGQDVSSGIYLIAAFSEDGSQVATGKVAVIRR